MNSDLRSLAVRGVELCRRDRWEEGMEVLARVTQVDTGSIDLPSQFYAYLGYGLARRERRLQEGLRLCEHAVRLGFYEVENYWMLARTAQLARSRRRAVRAIQRGLKVDPGHRGLRQMRQELGRRRRPVLAFLDRGHPLNRILGRLRHSLLGFLE